MSTYDDNNNEDNRYVHDNVTITVNEKKVEIPVPPDISPDKEIISTRNGKAYTVRELADLYNLYGSWNRIQTLTGISDKTVKRNVLGSGLVTATPTQHKQAMNAEPRGTSNSLPQNNRTGNDVIATKSSKIMDLWTKNNSGKLMDTMTTLLDSLTNPQIIERASLRDRAIAFGIVTERMQKTKELEIRKDEVKLKRQELARRSLDQELEARKVAALEKGVTINVSRRFEDVSDVVPVEEVNGGNSDGK